MFLLLLMLRHDVMIFCIDVVDFIDVAYVVHVVFIDIIII